MHSLPRVLDRSGRRAAWEGRFRRLTRRPLMAVGDGHAEPGDELTAEGAAEAIRAADSAGLVVSDRGRGGGAGRLGDPRAGPGPGGGAADCAAGRLGADRQPVAVPTGLHVAVGTAAYPGRPADYGDRTGRERLADAHRRTAGRGRDPGPTG